MIFCHEKFDDFELGEFPYDKGHSALGEYHFFMPEGYKGNWYDPISLHQFRGMDGSWMVTENDNKHYMEQNRGCVSFDHFKDLVQVLVYRSEFLTNYTVSSNIIMHDTKRMCGLSFKYVHGLKLYACVFEDQKIKIYYKDDKGLHLIDFKDFKYESLIEYNLKIEIKDDNCKVYINNILYLDSKVDKIKKGKTALYSSNTCKYSDFIIEMTDDNYNLYLKEIDDYKKLLEEKKKKYPKLKLINKIDLKKYGTGRHIRFGIINNEPFMVLAQHQKRMYRDAFASISCLTAMKMDGSVMWSIGEANNKIDNTLISADLPFQIHDIDNDGNLEVIYAKDFKVFIIDALTGKVKKEMVTPLMADIDPNYPFDHLNVDAIRVADFSNMGYKSDFIIKDRYKNVWAFDRNFNLLFRYNHKNTGHFPFIYDFDNDGVDEMFVGYDMVKDGKIKWSLDYNSDHTDEIIYTKLDDNLDPSLILASGNEGLNIINMDGSVRHHINIGHAQRISVAKYDNNLSGYQICATSFWGNNGIIYSFDKDGNLINAKEVENNGNVISPILYDGINNLILLNGNDGIMDINLDIVINFLEEDRPRLCSDSVDIDNDGIDEIILWDQEKMYIYKASEFVKPDEFIRYPSNSFSNYRGEYIIRKK